MFATAETNPAGTAQAPLTLAEALEIVLSLARENALDAKFVDSDILQQEIARQQAAIKMVFAHRSSLIARA